MTRKTLGYVKLAWTCPHCDSENLGPRKFCNGCGAPQPEDIEFHQAAQEVMLTDQGEIARAKAGPDVHCPYCRARNRGDASFCSACGGNLEGGETRASGAVVGAHKEGEQADVACPSCGTLNPATALHCIGCGDGLTMPQPKAKETGKPQKRTPVGVFIGIGAILVVAILVWVFLSQRTNERIGTVESVSWMRTIPIEALVDVEAEAWIDEIPSSSEAVIVSCTEQFRETVDEPVADGIEVCGTPYTVDTGSGFGEVVQDCQYEVYSDWCTYTTVDWGVVDSVTMTGEDLSPEWPEAQLLEGQRLGDGQELYEVFLLTDGETFLYIAEDPLEFGQFVQGTTWILNVNTFGKLLSVDRLE